MYVLQKLVVFYGTCSVSSVFTRKKVGDQNQNCPFQSITVRMITIYIFLSPMTLAGGGSACPFYDFHKFNILVPFIEKIAKWTPKEQTKNNLASTRKLIFFSDKKEYWFYILLLDVLLNLKFRVRPVNERIIYILIFFILNAYLFSKCAMCIKVMCGGGGHNHKAYASFDIY